MLQSLSIKSVASFSPQQSVIIEGLKRVNLFFGLNGAGKSTIANYLQNPSLECFSQCSYQPDQLQEEILVYNQKFIDDNFYLKPTQSGIFTVGEEGKNIQEDIDKKSLEIEKLNDKLNKIRGRGENLKSELSSLKDDFKEAIWKEKKAFDRSPLSFCLKGNATKTGFLEKVLVSKGLTSKTIEGLQQEAKEISENPKPRSEINKISFSSSHIEGDKILEQRIIGSEDSYLSKLIDSLNNSDWVKTGIRYIESSTDCPFCQRELPAEFKDELKKVFNKEYELSIEQLNTLQSKYSHDVLRLQELLASECYDHEYVTKHSELKALFDNLKSVVKSNLVLLNNKVNNPSDKVVLDCSNDVILEINAIIDTINSEVLSFNKKLEQKAQIENDIKNDFWKLIYNRCENTIDLFKQSVINLNDKIGVLRDEYQLEFGKKKLLNQEISELQNKASSTESSIVKINNQLKSLGVMSFYIESLKDQVGLYKISRGKQVNTEEKVYKTLSEGEKTLITFLYFVETCFGSNTKNAPTILSNRIIVIDDPISSLSHNYVFDIASMIHHRIIGNDFKQVLILTHNLYFFHELLLLKSPNPNNQIKEYNLFRVSKSEFSSIESMERHSLQNDYQTYWQVVKDCKEGKAQPNMLPNAMRNILEYYFNFIHKQANLKKALDEIGENNHEFKPLFRYINRKSHSDSINLFDTGAVTTEKYLEKFKEIFTETGYEEHYSNMIGD